jgi:hypothetical protein
MLSSATPELSFFQIIYNAALLEEEKTITETLDYVTIDVETTGVFPTPISQLAAEGHTQAVTFLQTKFQASSRGVLHGYGYAKNWDAAQIILDAASSYEEYFDLLISYISGLACANHRIEIKNLMATLSKSEQGKLAPFVVTGLVISGNPELADLWITENKHKDNLNITLAAKMAGFVRRGDHPLAEELLAHNLVQLGERLSELSRWNDDMQFSLQGAFFSTSPDGSLSDPQRQMYEHITYQQHLIYCLGRIGLIELARQKIELYSLNNAETRQQYGLFLIDGLGRGGHHALAKGFIRAQTNENYFDKLIEMLVKGLARSGSISHMNNLFEMLNYPQQKADLIITAIESYGRGGFLQQAQAVVPVKSRTWTPFMQKYLSILQGNNSKPIYVRNTLDYITEYLAERPRGQLPEALEPFVTLKIRKLAENRGKFNLSYSQTLMWQYLPIFLQISRTNKISVDMAILIFQFLEPISPAERNVACIKSYIHVHPKRFFNTLATNPAFIPVISTWEEKQAALPKRWRNPTKFFKELEEHKLIEATITQLKCEPLPKTLTK